MNTARIPSFGFARGAVVRLRAGGPNMLVVRGFDRVTVVIAIMADAAGSVRLFEVATDDLELILEQGPVTPAAEQAMAAYFRKYPLKPSTGEPHA